MIYRQTPHRINISWSQREKSHIPRVLPEGGSMFIEMNKTFESINKETMKIDLSPLLYRDGGHKKMKSPSLNIQLLFKLPEKSIRHGFTKLKLSPGKLPETR